MSEPVRFLNHFAQALATMSLYGDGHPARERTIDGAYGSLQRLLETENRPRFSFLGDDVIHGEQALRELGDWGWGSRLANAGVQRIAAHHAPNAVRPVPNLARQFDDASAIAVRLVEQHDRRCCPSTVH